MLPRGSQQVWPPSLHSERHRERWLALRQIAARCADDDLREVDGENPSCMWLFGTTMVEAELELSDEIALRSWLVISPDAPGSWAQRLAHWEGGLPFGRLVVDKEGDVVLVHQIPAATPAEGVASQILEFCKQADALDDILLRHLGGISAQELFQREVLEILARELSQEGAPEVEGEG